MADFSKMLKSLVESAKESGACIEIQPDRGHEEKLASASRLDAAYQAGVKAASDRFKVSFLGALAGMAAGPIARAGLARLAPRAASMVAKPIAGAMFDYGMGQAANKMLG